MRRLLTTRRFCWLDALVLALLTVLVIACVRLWVPPDTMLSRTTDLSRCYIARTANDLLYAIDEGHSRLVVFDDACQERFQIVDPSDDGQSVLYIDDVFVDGDDLYLTASEWDGMLLSRELILAYDSKGAYKRTVYELTYDLGQNGTNKHRIYGLHREGDQLMWAECWDDEICVRYPNHDASSEPGMWNIPYKNAFNAVADIVFVGGAPVVLDKNGRITCYARGSDSQLLYSTSWQGEEERMPFRLAFSDGTCYFTDIRSGAVYQVDPEKRRSQPILEGTDSQTVTFSADGKKMLLAQADGVRVVGQAGEALFGSLTIDREQQARHAALLVCLVVGGICAVLAIVRLVFMLRGIRAGTFRRGPIVAVAVTFIACAVVSCVLLDSFLNVYIDKHREQLQMTASQVALRVTEDELAGVRQAQDFDSDAYRGLIATMEQTMPLDVDFFHTVYCNILVKDASGEGGHAIAYRDQSIGTYFPLDEVEAAEVNEVYQTGQPIWNDEVLDVSGSYVSVKTPVFGKDGRVIGVVAVGSDSPVIIDLLADMIKKVLVSVVLVLLLFWILATEGVALMSKAAVATDPQSGAPAAPMRLIRVLVFAVFAAFNLVSSFLPVYALRQSGAIDGAWREVASTLPLTVNIFVMGVMSLFCASAIRRLGARRVFAGSMLCSLVGNALLFANMGYIGMVLGLLLDGIGVGMVTNAIYVVLTYLPSEDAREDAFSTYNGASKSGINFGMILGSVLAVGMGQRMVFAVVAVVWLLLMFVGLYVARRMERLVPASEGGAVGGVGSISLGRFLSSRPIWSFILLIQNPYIVFNGFAYYFVPVFCDGAGYGETAASVLLALYSQTAVMLSGPLTRQVEKSFGGRSVYLALALNVVAVALYMSTPGIWALVGALLVLGVSASFAKPCQQAFYLRQDASRQLGEDRAMGIYNFSENIGESLGPTVFGNLMAGPAGYVWAFLGSIGCAGVAHFALNRKREGDENSRNERQDVPAFAQSHANDG
ncbi:MAG: MFS transporter [Eggerthellaceae bacterium]|nr:MFS transporter [Eggerthellaceae bacterium]